uniref:Uncharacterized protein n=1 Tax=Plectus sambesii TaxID=2011161 RepID=A0A914WYS4_9BILA
MDSSCGEMVALLLFVSIQFVSSAPHDNETSANKTSVFGGNKNLTRKLPLTSNGIQNQVLMFACCFIFFGVFAMWAFVSIIRLLVKDDMRSTHLYSGSYDEGSATPDYDETATSPHTYGGGSNDPEDITPGTRPNWPFLGKLVKSETTEEYLTPENEEKVFGNGNEKIYATTQSKASEPLAITNFILPAAGDRRNLFARSKRETTIISGSPFEQLSPVFNDNPGDIFLPDEMASVDQRRAIQADRYEQILRPDTLGPFSYAYLAPQQAEMVQSAPAGSAPSGSDQYCTPGEIFLADITEEDDEISSRGNAKAGSV